MAAANSRQRRTWNPQTLFNITNLDTCIGWAHTKNRRCQRPIGRDRRNAARYLMDRLAFIEPHQIMEQETVRLEDIVFNCLCRTHLEGPHGQWQSIVNEWVTRLEEEQTRLEFRQTRREIEHTERDAFASARIVRLDSWTSMVSSRSTLQDRIDRSERSTSPTNSHVTPQFIETPPTAIPIGSSPVLPESTSALASPGLVAAQPLRNQQSAEDGGEVNMFTRVENIHRDIQRRFENVQREFEDIRRTVDGLVQYIATRRTELQRPSQTDDAVPLPVITDQEQEPPLSASPTLELDIIPGSELEAEPIPSPAIAQQCLLHQASRRSIDENCPICIMPMVNCMLSELVWCKRQCGRSVHKECFELMLELTSNNMRCVYWSVSLWVTIPKPMFITSTKILTLASRSSWSISCRHDEQYPEEFEFWAQWDLGFDTFFDPQHHRYDFWNTAYETDLPSLFHVERYSEQLHNPVEGSEEN